MSTQQRIDEMVKSKPVFLFMKGTPDFPQCGFSMRAVSILNALGVDYGTFDVLSDMEVRQGIKDYANWPTIPQLYMKGDGRRAAQEGLIRTAAPRATPPSPGW